MISTAVLQSTIASISILQRPCGSGRTRNCGLSVIASAGITTTPMLHQTGARWLSLSRWRPLDRCHDGSNLEQRTVLGKGEAEMISSKCFWYLERTRSMRIKVLLLLEQIRSTGRNLAAAVDFATQQ